MSDLSDLCICSYQAMEGVDVFCFGFLLYEMTYGQPPDSVPVNHYPAVPSAAAGQYIPTDVFAAPNVYPVCSVLSIMSCLIKKKKVNSFSYSPYYHLAVCVCALAVSVLQSILSADACKGGMPTLSELLHTP